MEKMIKNVGLDVHKNSISIGLQEYIDTVTDCTDRVHRLTEQVRLQSSKSGRHELIKALQSMRGISLIVAATIASELGDLTRFETPGKLMAFLGLIPSEHSSGDQVKKGSITKTGNRHVRNALVEAAHAQPESGDAEEHLRQGANKGAEQANSTNSKQ